VYLLVIVNNSFKETIMADKKAQLQQVDKDIEALKANKRAIEKEIAEAEVTYSVGDRFHGRHGSKWIIVIQMKGTSVAMADLKTGCLACGSADVIRTDRITKQELREFGGSSFTRYWDNRKQVRV
jgi:hypothetical protein